MFLWLTTLLFKNRRQSAMGLPSSAFILLPTILCRVSISCVFSAPLWASEDSYSIPDSLTGHGPFESTDDNFYRNLSHIDAVVAKGEDDKEKLIEIGININNKTQETYLKSKDSFVIIKQNTVDGGTSVNQFPKTQNNTVDDLRDYVDRMRSAAEEMLEATARINNLTDEQLVASYEDIFAKDFAGLLSGEMELRSSVRDLQELLCPTLKQDAIDFQRWMMEKVLESVGSLIGESVSLKDVQSMHAVVKYVERYQGIIQVTEPDFDGQNSESVWKNFDLKLLENDEETDHNGSKTVKKVLTHA